jgi:predicted RND superfamily exporter protein
MTQNKSGGLIKNLATFIVDKRNLFFLLYIIGLVFSLFSMGWVNVENDITKYLPEETETRQGLEAMNEYFEAFGTARIMVSNVTYEVAEELSDTARNAGGFGSTGK